MRKINLRDYYPFYKIDLFIEVPEEIAEALRLFALLEKSYRLRDYRHKAYFSLNRNDGIERDIISASLTPYELYEKKVSNLELYSAINNLPENQAKRIYAYFFMGLSKADIAKSEGVGESAVRGSIKRGLKNVEKLLKNHL